MLEIEKSVIKTLLLVAAVLVDAYACAVLVTSLSQPSGAGGEGPTTSRSGQQPPSNEEYLVPANYLVVSKGDQC